MHTHLRPSPAIDSDHPAVQAFARQHWTAGALRAVVACSAETRRLRPQLAGSELP